jgi:arylsulfatase
MRSLCGAVAAFAALLAAMPADAQTAAKKPNILVIFGDDIGQSNISAYSRGLMGFTPRTSTASAPRAASS